MKLTKTIKDKFLADILSKEVASPDFAGEISLCMKELISPMMPVAVAAIYNHSATSDWVSPAKVLELKAELVRRTDRGELNAKQAVLSRKIAAIEKRRDDHSRTLDNIRAAVTVAMDSVTTVNGLVKQLPQFAKYLPIERQRPDDTAVQAALFTVGAVIAKAKTDTTPKPRIRGSKPSRRA
jgi:hypothetical protein